MTIKVFKGDSRLSDVNVQDVTVAEFIRFMDDLAEEMPAIYKQVIRKAAKQISEVDESGETKQACKGCTCHQGGCDERHQSGSGQGSTTSNQ